MTPGWMVPDSYPLTILGWTVLLALWESAAVALALGAWRLASSKSSPANQHRAASMAFATTVLATMATPFFLAAVQPLSMALTVEFPAGPSASIARVVARSGVGTRVAGTISTPLFGSFVALLALGWSVGVGVLTVRFVAGCLWARRIRRRATAVRAPDLGEIAARLSVQPGLHGPVALLESRDVDAPVVIGWRSPVLILPDYLTSEMPRAGLEPLIAHELRHVARGDYLANLLQSGADILLFFSPPAWWISARIRDAREYDCDDAAAAACDGDVRRYAQALTMLASLGSVHRMRPALGAAGPRLIVRIRRLLEGHAMPRFLGTRIAAIGLLLVGVGISAYLLSRASVTHVMAAGQAAASAGVGKGAGAVPLGYVMEQPGSSLTFGPITQGTDYLVASAHVRNAANVDVSAVAFVAIVEDQRSRQPVRILTTELMPFLIPAGSTVQVPVRLLATSEVEKLKRHFGDTIQSMVGVLRVEYSNGAAWETTPNPAARTSQVALNLPPAEVARGLVGLLATVTAVEVESSQAPYEKLSFSGKSFEMELLKPAAGCGFGAECSVCYDDRGREYSEGAIVPISREPGQFAKCESRRWVETQ